MSNEVQEIRSTSVALSLIATTLLSCFGCRAPGFQTLPFWRQVAVVTNVGEVSSEHMSQSANSAAHLSTTASSQVEGAGGVDISATERPRFSQVGETPVTEKRATQVPALPSAGSTLPQLALTNLARQSSQTAASNIDSSEADQPLYPEPALATNSVADRKDPLASSVTTAALPAAIATKTATTTLRITNVRTDVGPVRLAVFTNPATFPSPESAAWTHVAEPTNSVVTVACPQAGLLAVAVYQDVNRDGELNRNRFGIPLEPYVFSNGAKGDRGPPTFSEAVVNAAPDKPIFLTLP